MHDNQEFRDFMPGRIQARRKKRGAPDEGLRKIFMEKLKRGCQWTAIETGMTAQGVPDANYCFNGGHEGWLECKKTDAWAVRMRVLQVGWILRRIRMGGHVCIAIRRATDELWLVDGAFVAELAAGGLKNVPHVKWVGGKDSWDWKQIEQYLRSPCGWAFL
jgi:hypothetical protein